MLQIILFYGYSLQLDLSYGVFIVDRALCLTSPSIILLPGLCEIQQSTSKGKKGQQLDWHPLGLLVCGIRWQTQLGFGAVTRVFVMAKGPFVMRKRYIKILWESKTHSCFLQYLLWVIRDSYLLSLDNTYEEGI